MFTWAEDASTQRNEENKQLHFPSTPSKDYFVTLNYTDLKPALTFIFTCWSSNILLTSPVTPVSAKWIGMRDLASPNFDAESVLW